MKNTTKIMGLLLLVAIIGFSFSACGDDSPKDALDGTTWKGNNVDVEIVLKFKSPNVTITQSSGGITRTDTGTYSISGNVVTVKTETMGTITGTLSGNTITLDNGITYKKQ